MDLTGKVVAITGASRGLGAGLAKVAFEHGGRLVLCSRGAPVLPASERVLVSRLDVTDAAAVDALAQSAFARFGHVDVWINNAGVLEPVGPLRTAKPDDLRRLMEVNVLGVAFGTRAYARALRARVADGTGATGEVTGGVAGGVAGGVRGVLLNISSGAARKAYYGWSAYCASKAAVDRLSEAVALEERPHLRVYSIAPGVIDTDMQALIRSKDETQFVDVPRFRAMHAQGELASPTTTAEKLLRFALTALTTKPSKPAPVCVDLR